MELLGPSIYRYFLFLPIMENLKMGGERPFPFFIKNGKWKMDLRQRSRAAI